MPDKKWLHSTGSAEEGWSLDDTRCKQDLDAGDDASQKLVT